MAPGKATYPILALLLLLLLLAAVAVAAEAKPTAYDMLERYDFPRGILPEGVEGYELGPDGGFEVYFPRQCEFMLAKQWLVKYDKRIAGTATADKLTDLEGIYVKVLFLWIPVSEVDRAGDRLSFYIGPVSTSFPLGDFADSPHCRGYDYDVPPPSLPLPPSRELLLRRCWLRFGHLPGYLTRARC